MGKGTRARPDATDSAFSTLPQGDPDVASPFNTKLDGLVLLPETTTPTPIKMSPNCLRIW